MNNSTPLNEQLRQKRSGNRRLWPFTRKRANGPTATPSTSSEAVKSSGTWYHSIYETPMSVFIRCQLQSDVTALIIEGPVLPRDLLDAWSQLVSAYHEAIGNTETIRRFFLYKEIGLLAIVLREIYLSIEALKYQYVPFFHSKLDQLLECSLPLDQQEFGTEAYFTMLRRYFKRSSSVSRALRLKEMEFDALDKGDPATKQKTDRGYYDKIFISLTDHAKVHIDDSITVFVFCERVRRMTEAFKQVKK